MGRETGAPRPQRLGRWELCHSQNSAACQACYPAPLQRFNTLRGTAIRILNREPQNHCKSSAPSSLAATAMTETAQNIIPYLKRHCKQSPSRAAASRAVTAVTAAAAGQTGGSRAWTKGDVEPNRSSTQEKSTCSRDHSSFLGLRAVTPAHKRKPDITPAAAGLGCAARGDGSTYMSDTFL